MGYSGTLYTQLSSTALTLTRAFGMAREKPIRCGTSITSVLGIGRHPSTKSWVSPTLHRAGKRTSKHSHQRSTAGQYQPYASEERISIGYAARTRQNKGSCVQHQNLRTRFPRNCSSESIRPLSNFHHGFQRQKTTRVESTSQLATRCGSGTALTCSCRFDTSTRAVPLMGSKISARY